MENNTTAGLAPTGYVLPKKWDEITSDEKVERMREIIKQLQHAVARSQSDNHNLRQSFKKHFHTEKEIIVPYDEYSNNGAIGIGSQLSSVENYF
jgi:hypothetical protein